MVTKRLTLSAMTLKEITGQSSQMVMGNSRKILESSKLAGVVMMDHTLNMLISMEMERKTCCVMTLKEITGLFLLLLVVHLQDNLLLEKLEK
jgi:hypothetical protein